MESSAVSFDYVVPVVIIGNFLLILFSAWAVDRWRKRSRD